MGKLRTGGMASQSLTLILASGVSAGLSMAYVSVTGRMLGPARFGEVTAALALTYLASLLLGPFETAFTKLAAELHGAGARGKLSRLTEHYLAGGAKVALAALALWIPLSVRLHGALHVTAAATLVAVGGYTAASFLLAIARGALRGEERFAAYGENQVVEAVARLAFGVPLVLLTASATGAMLGYGAGVAAALGFATWQLRELRSVPREDVRAASWATFSAPLTFAYIYFLGVTNLDVLGAKRWLTGEEAGLYGAASSLARMLFILATPVYQVLFSRVAAREAAIAARASAGATVGRASAGASTRVTVPPRTSDDGSTPRLVLRVAVIMTVLLAASFVVPWFFGRALLVTIFGASFGSAVATLRILWVSTSLLIVQTTCVFALLAAGRARGAALFLLPVLGMVLALARHHGDARAVALVALGAIASGALPLIVMIAAASRRR